MKARIAVGLERVALVALGCGLALALLETGLRVAGRLWSWQRERANVVATDGADTIRVLCVGESTTALGGPDAYPRKLEILLNRQKHARRYGVVNAGVPGITTDAVVQQLDELLDRYRPHVVVAMLGINDALVEDPGAHRLPSYSSWRVVKVAQLAIGNLRARLTPGPTDDPISRDALAAIAAGDVDRAREVLLSAPADHPRDCPDGPLCATAHALVTGLTVSSRFDDAEQFARAWIRAHPEDTTMREMTWGLRLAEAGRDVHQRRLDVADAKLAALDRVIPAEAHVSRAAMMAIRATIAERRDMPADAARYRAAAEALRMGRWRESTERNYRRLADVLHARGIRLVAMQYPLRSVASLRAILGDAPDVVFVDNEATFRDALRSAAWETWFVDAFAGDFGHTTPAGALLIAGNAAHAILTLPRADVLVTRSSARPD